MNKTKKIAIFISLAAPLFLLPFVSNAAEGDCSSKGGKCYISDNNGKCLASEEYIQPCRDDINNDGKLETGECCKPKTSTAGTSAQASATGNSGLIPASHKVDGNYSINDLLQVAVNVSNKIFGLAGSAALLAFVYGGITMVISAGSQEKVAKGKAILIGAVIGLVIVFTGYLIVDTVTKGLDKKGDPWNTSKP